MTERKSKHGTEENIELGNEEAGFILEPAQVEVGSGYTVAVSYDEHDKPIIDVKTYGQVDTAKMRREIERVFPNAKIRQHAQETSISIARKSKKKPKNKPR
jgi:hypothetical protein